MAFGKLTRMPPFRLNFNKAKSRQLGPSTRIPSVSAVSSSLECTRLPCHTLILSDTELIFHGVLNGLGRSHCVSVEVALYLTQRKHNSNEQGRS